VSYSFLLRLHHENDTRGPYVNSMPSNIQASPDHIYCQERYKWAVPIRSIAMGNVAELGWAEQLTGLALHSGPHFDIKSSPKI